MSSILALFWPSATTTAAAPAAVEPTAVPTSTAATHVESSDESFVLIDSIVPGDDVAATTKTCHSRSDSWQMEEPLNAPITASDEESTKTRSCRPYGHAHKPPALIPAAAAADVDSSSTTASSSKRSFADILRATNSGSTSSSSANRRVAYAQDASLSISEQLLAKIEQLESALDAGADVSSFFPADASDLSIQDAINTTSPSLRPQSFMSLESARMYDSPTNWALEVAEPTSKRAKHAAAPLVLHHKTHGRGPSRKQAKVQAKAHARSCEDKNKMAL